MVGATLSMRTVVESMEKAPWASETRTRTGIKCNGKPSNPTALKVGRIPVASSN
jgi:hypothetical protein